MRPAFIALPLLALALAPLAGCGTPSFLVTPVANVQRLDEVQIERGRGWRAPKVAVIEVEGMLLNARSGGFMQPTENKLSLFSEQLDRAAADEDVRAVVLRINSPGGTVTASDTMYQMLVRFREQTGKPVVASLQDVAASGAYYVACGADQIVAHPTSVVGSIGVIFNTFNFEGTLAKLGARAEAIKSGPLKDMGSMFRALGPDERQVMQAMVDEYHGRFVAVVTRHRSFDSEADQLTATDGRVFSGAQALELGLVDRLGLIDEAVVLARQLAGAPDAGVVMYKRPYGYKGSIYAGGSNPQPQANVLYLELPGLTDVSGGGSTAFLPSGFYYMWQP